MIMINKKQKITNQFNVEKGRVTVGDLYRP